MAFEGMTFAQLIEEVLVFQFSQQKYEPLVKRWLNTAQRKVYLESEQRRAETSQAYSTTSGSNTLEIPSNYSRLIDFYNVSTGRSLEELDLQEFDNLPPEERGEPDQFAAEGETLRLYPIPNGVYSLALRYWKLPADMVNPTDEPELAKRYHELLIAYPMWKAYLRENDYSAAQTWEAIWEKGLLKLRGEVQGDTFDGPQQVEGGWPQPQFEPRMTRP